MIDLLRRHPAGRVALIDGAGRTSYGELLGRADAAARALRAAAGERPLVFLAMSPEPGAVALYLGCLAAGLPVCLTDREHDRLEKLARAYEPGVLVLPADATPPSGYREAASPEPTHRLWRRDGATPLAVHPDLALLLTTSGSTGSPRLVRLAMRNLEANAVAIARYLEIGEDERAIASLPMHYSYGLSVLHSHLVAGAAVVLTAHSFLRPEFWSAVDAERCTSFAGVPYMYETLHRLRFDPARHGSLRSYTQAGGALRKDLTVHFHERVAAAGGRFWVMYGQTEATARISYVPPAELGRKIGSIGIAIPGGTLDLAPVPDDPSLDELVYRGPNVMLGYADSPADLALGDVQGGALRTGDLGARDADGYFSVTGRLKRFAKLFGRRVSLEDIERDLESSFDVRVAATDGGDRILLHVEKPAPSVAAAIVAHEAKLLGVPPAAVHVVAVDALPRTSSGKKDYKALGVSG